MVVSAVNSSLTIIDADVGLDAAGGGGGGDRDDLGGRGRQDADGGRLEHVLLLADRGQHGRSHRHCGTHTSIWSQSTSTFTFSPPLFDMSRTIRSTLLSCPTSIWRLTDGAREGEEEARARRKIALGLEKGRRKRTSLGAGRFKVTKVDLSCYAKHVSWPSLADFLTFQLQLRNRTLSQLFLLSIFLLDTVKREQLFYCPNLNGETWHATPVKSDRLFPLGQGLNACP